MGKRTVIRQGKQVVFRDEDGTGDDEDIMVDSGRWPGQRERSGRGEAAAPGPISSALVARG